VHGASPYIKGLAPCTSVLAKLSKKTHRFFAWKP